jgi:hypothetical protein
MDSSRWRRRPRRHEHFGCTPSLTIRSWTAGAAKACILPFVPPHVSPTRSLMGAAFGGGLRPAPRPIRPHMVTPGAKKSPFRPLIEQGPRCRWGLAPTGKIVNLS